MILGILRVTVIDHIYVPYHVQAHLVHERKRTFLHPGEHHPPTIHILKIHKPVSPHVEHFAFDGSPHAIETKAQKLSVHGERDEPDGANPVRSLLENLRKSSRSSHEVHHVDALQREIKVDVQATLGSAAHFLEPGDRHGGTVGGQNSAGSRFLT